MNRHAISKIQVTELRRLLEEVGDDPILGPQFRERLEEAEEGLRNNPPPSVSDSAELPKTAMFLRGGGVQGSFGVRPALAAEVLTQYERMFTAQALHGEREIAREAGRARRPKGASMPGLWFTGTPHGSFGLEFVPQTPDDPSTQQVYRDAITTVTDALVGIASADSVSADKALASVASSVYKPMRMFLRSLVAHGAELRVAFQGQRSRSISAVQIANAAEQLEREVTHEQVTLAGTFRGVTLHSGYFDFLAEDGREITGEVADELLPEDLENIHQRTNQPAHAVMLVTTIRPVTGETRITYVLVKAMDSTSQLPAAAAEK